MEIRLAAAHGEGDAISDALSQAGALSVSMEDAADDPVLEPAPGETPLWPSTTVIGLFDATTDPDEIVQKVCHVLGLESMPEVRISRVEGRDWERARLDELRPLCFGNRLWVCPSGMTVDAPDAVTIDLDAGLAFGTGTHPTTALCLEWLDQHCRPGDRVIDYGCGSGILAIAAIRLGAAQAWATDIDPQALLATGDNAHRNGVADRIRIVEPGALPTMRIDCILANILANPLIELAPRFAALLTPGGRLTVSGILAEQEEAVAAALAHDFELQGRGEQDQWIRLDALRRADSL